MNVRVKLEARPKKQPMPSDRTLRRIMWVCLGMAAVMQIAAACAMLYVAWRALP